MADKRRRKNKQQQAQPQEPSVHAFLSRITGQPRSITTAGRTVRNLLGDVGPEDLRRAGRTIVVQDAYAEPPQVRGTAAVAAEISTPPTPASPSKEDLAALRPKRLRVRMPVEIRGVFHPPGAPPVATDLSVGGVFVETASPLDVGDPVVVGFPGGGDGAFSVNGRVRWVTPFGRLNDARPGMGIEFVGVDAFKRARLHELLARRAKEDAS